MEGPGSGEVGKEFVHDDPSRAQRIVPITFLMIMKNLIRVNSIQTEAEYFQDDVDFYLAQYGHATLI